jgi:hypothetical protein
MGLIDIVRQWSKSVAFSLALATSPLYVSSCGSECENDNDCATELGRVCEDGECVAYESGNGENSSLCVNYCEGIMRCCDEEGDSFSDLCNNLQRCVSECDDWINRDPRAERDTRDSVRLRNNGCCYLSNDDNGETICTDDKYRERSR